MNSPPAKTCPGTSVCIDGQGILITGASGAGKSLLALSLLDRGHALICDDATRLTQQGDDILLSHEKNITGQLEVRHLGIISVEEFFGKSAIKNNVPLKLIIDLQSTNLQPLQYDRLRPNMTSTTVLGMAINQLNLPAKHSNLALIVELSVKALITSRQQDELAMS